MSPPPFAELLSRPSIAEATRATFGNIAIEEAEPLRGGLSAAALLKLTVGGRAYALRCSGQAPGSDPARELACMRIAAERGLAPQILYANVEQGISITEFVDGVPLNAWLRAGGDGIQKLGTVIRALHDGPAFPPFISVSQACLAVAASLERRGAAPPLARELLSRAEETRVALAPHLSEAPCHNDLNPGNIVVAGGRLWLVDWEAAGAGDPFHDLATPGVLLFHAPEQRAQLLRACLGREPSPVETARLALSRALSLTLFALVFANVGSGRNGTPPPAPERVRDPVLNPAQFGAQLASEAERNYASTEHANALVLLR